jgi:hypothetical protein
VALVKKVETKPDQFYQLVVQLLPKERAIDMTTRTATLEDFQLEINLESELHSFSAHIDNR